MNVDKVIQTVFDCNLSPVRRPKWQSKTQFLAIMIHVRRLLRALSIAPYPVCLLFAHEVV